MCSPFVMVVSRRSARRRPPQPSPLSCGTRPGGSLPTPCLVRLRPALGQAVDLAGTFIGFQRATAAIAGGVLVIWAIVALLAWPPRGTGARRLVFARVARLLKGRIPPHPLLIGLFLGLLPCGLLYSAVIAAAPRGGPLAGATALAVFGAHGARVARGIGRRRPALSGTAQMMNRVPVLAGVRAGDGRLVPLARTRAAGARTRRRSRWRRPPRLCTGGPELRNKIGASLGAAGTARKWVDDELLNSGSLVLARRWAAWCRESPGSRSRWWPWRSGSGASIPRWRR